MKRSGRLAWLAAAMIAVLGCAVWSAPVLRGATVRALPGPNTPAIRASTFASKYYDVMVENGSAGDAGAMLDQLHDQLERHFGAAPKGRLSVAVFATSQRCADAVSADKQGRFPNAGGYYAPGNRKAYLFVQPSEQFTRQLMLHEATHQFHWQVAAGNRAPSAGWYDEGLSEYFGMHNWDGKALRTGVVPAVTLEDYPAAALRQLDKLRGGVSAAMEGREQIDRPLAWAIVHYLMNKDGERFRKFAAMLDAHQPPAQALKAVYGESEAPTAEQLRAWIESNSQPWRIVWTAWQPRGEAIEGDSGVNSLAVLKTAPKLLRAELEPSDKRGWAGLVYGYQSPQDFCLFQVNGSHYRLMRRTEGRWIAQASGSLPPAQSGTAGSGSTASSPPSGRDVLSIEAAGQRLSLRANGKEVASVPAAGLMGLNTDACTVRFVVRTEGVAELPAAPVPVLAAEGGN